MSIRTPIFVGLVAILMGTGLVKVDPTPLFSSMGKLIPETNITSESGKLLEIKNKDILQYFEEQAIKAKTAKSKCAFPLQGLYMFSDMGPAALIDFGKLTNCNTTDNSADSNLADAAVQKGVPPLKFGGIGPYLPGGWVTKAFAAMQYNVRWFCPSKLEDGEYCALTESFMGMPYPAKQDIIPFKGHGPMTWIMVQSEGGRKYTRKSWLNFPWATISEEYIKTHATFHEYNLLRIIDGEGNIDQEHVQLFMEKQDGQDLVFASEEAM